MLQIFTTQLQGLLKKLKDSQEEAIEDGARLLAQATINSANIYMYGEKEMKAVVAEALYGEDSFTNTKALHFTEQHRENALEEIGSFDRVVVITRSSKDTVANDLAQQLAEKQIPYIAICTIEDLDDVLVNNADVTINLQVHKALVPMDDGTRIGYPTSLIALYTYFCLSLTLNEIMSELEEE
ncbi:hypothetical protein BTS2_1241 [Bacillus sp. TS-2]|nr:hypothetical protein BTS2_1241 [Bacillus sp. TS-2]